MLAFQAGRLPKGPRVGFVTTSGGTVDLLYDYVEEIGGITTPDFDADTKKNLKAFKGQIDDATKFIPLWVKVAVAIALGLGTMVGWKRIVVTVGEKIGKTHLTYAQGASAELVGVGSGAMDRTVNYLKERKQFGQAIGSFQALQHRAAHLYSEMEVARAAVLKAQQLLDAGDPAAGEAVMVAKAMSALASTAADVSLRATRGAGRSSTRDHRGRAGGSSAHPTPRSRSG